jgi:hypothetical protein
MTTAQVVRQSVEVFSLIYPDHSIVSVLDFWFTCSSHHLIAGISCFKEALRQAAGREVYLFCCGMR